MVNMSVPNPVASLTSIRQHTIPYLSALLNCDIETAKKTPVTWQIIPVKGKSAVYPEILYGSINKLYKRLLSLNELDAGIYITINHSGTNERTLEDIKALRATWVDLDDKDAVERFTHDDLALLTPQPTFGVISGHGWHLYEILSQPVPVTRESIEVHKRILLGSYEQMRQHGSDRGAIDYSRVLRCPGFVNNKYDQHIMCEFLPLSGVTYTLEQLTEAHPYDGPLDIQKKPKSSSAPISTKLPFETSMSLQDRLEECQDELDEAEVGVTSIEGGDGSAEVTTLAAMRIGAYWGIPKADFFNMVMEEDGWNDQCLPPWDEAGIVRKIHAAYSFCAEKHSVGCRLPEYDEYLIQLGGLDIEDVQETERLERESDAAEKLPAINADAEIDEKCSKLSFDDLGFANRLKLRYGLTLQYYANDWYHYDGTHWVSNRKEVPIRALEKVKARIIKRELAYIESMEEKEKMVKWANSLGSAGHLIGASKLAVSLMARKNGFCVSSPTSVNFSNGTLELTTGEFHPHDPADNFLYCLPYAYNPEAKCTKWEKYLETVFGNDIETVQYVRALMGCTLLGNTDDEFAVWLSGVGSNGKTTFTETMQYILKGLAQQVPNDLFLTKKYGSSHPTEIARLNQIKFATCSDISTSAKLDEGTFKRLVSTGKATGRYMGKDFFEFDMTHKFWISVNSLPTVYDDTNGLWRRMIVIPFYMKFVRTGDGENQADIKIKDKLKAEAEGIWAWLIRAALDYTKFGLPSQPQMVIEACEEWHNQEDWWASFVSERCVVDEAKFVSSSSLYDTYSIWCDRNSQAKTKHKSFSKKVAQKGFKSEHRRDGNYFLGISHKFNDDNDGKWGFDD